MHGNQWVLKIAVLKYYSVSKRGTTAKSNPKQATDPISLHTKFGDNSSNTFPLNERKPCVTPDIGCRTPDIGHRTAKKAKIIYPPPRGVDIIIYPPPRGVDITTTNEVYTSPHVVQMDYHPLQGWDSPVTSSPKTPEVDIPRYYTSAYQSRRRELNLPEGITYQGPLTKDDEENPLPPHLNNSPVAWGNTPKKCESPQFQLIDYLEDMCTHITPPI